MCVYVCARVHVCLCACVCVRVCMIETERDTVSCVCVCVCVRKYFLFVRKQMSKLFEFLAHESDRNIDTTLIQTGGR